MSLVGSRGNCEKRNYQKLRKIGRIGLKIKFNSTIDNQILNGPIGPKLVDFSRFGKYFLHNDPNFLPILLKTYVYKKKALKRTFRLTFI